MTHQAPPNDAAVRSDDLDFRAPPSALDVGIWIAVAAIGMMFLAGMIGYAIVKQRYPIAIAVPTIFWFSTAMLVVSSVMMHYGWLLARANRRAPSARALYAAGALGVVFMLMQFPGLRALLDRHEIALEQRMTLYGIVLILVSLHGAHVLGGLIATLLTALKLDRPALPTDRPPGDHTRPLLIYWHALTVIWMAMFWMFTLLR
ncbi:MAG TPA: hypothetical protein PKB10_06065 [Tepidisphaeraceae bacterium]|nr:hypothetical protein [Tepidisphaeraceae bacterium]